MSQVINEDGAIFEMISQDRFVEKVNYPELGTVIPPAQYIQLNDVQRQNLDEMLSEKPTREQFLMKYHFTSIGQHLLMLGIFLLGLTRWFSSILVKHQYEYYWGYYRTYDDYKRSYGDSSSYYEYSNWRENQKYSYYEFRWTFFVVIALLLIVTLSISIGRAYQSIVRYQKKLFLAQTVLGGLILVGILGVSRDSWRYDNKILIIVFALNSLIVNSAIIITLVKQQKLHYYGKIKYIVMYTSVALNFIVALETYHMNNTFPIVEMIVFYGVYYYDQLNLSLMQDPKQLPEVDNAVEKIRNLMKLATQNQQVQEQISAQLGQEYVVINKKFAVNFGSFVGFIVFTILGFVIGTPTFIILGALSISSLIGLVLETQVASRTLSEEDNYIAVSLSYIDMLNPLKNVLRSFNI